ncbi:MAG TPA: hypothetical protein VGS22_05165 [Thermoanaerobaculia bacterium]|jgi:hypothetical protein|nr:hypothetical protein [Thermoanaerobaculia bacterium]
MRLESSIVALCFALILLATGAHAVVPWQLRRAAPEERRPWALGAALLLSLSGLAFLTLIGRSEDAVLASRLVPFAASPLSLALGTTAAGLCLADLLLLFAWRRLEDRGWPLLALFGATEVVAQSFALAALAGGDGKAPAVALALRALVLAALALAASEAITSNALRLPPFASLAGLGLPLLAFALPEAVRELFVSGGGLALLGAAAALLFATRFAARPARRRALALAGLLLAGFAWARAVDIAGALAGQLPAAEGHEAE